MSANTIVKLKSLIEVLINRANFSRQTETFLNLKACNEHTLEADISAMAAAAAAKRERKLARNKRNPL